MEIEYKEQLREQLEEFKLSDEECFYLTYPLLKQFCLNNRDYLKELYAKKYPNRKITKRNNKFIDFVVLLS
jgi:hypothetical protein